MKGSFDFRFPDLDSKNRDSLVIFFSGEFSADSVVKITKQDAEKNLIPSAVYVIVSQSKALEAARSLQDKSIMSEIDSFIGSPAEKLQLVSFCGDGTLKIFESDLLILPSIRDSIFSAGMLKIFGTRKGLIASSGNFHFLKPSGDHCDGFIRASNLLIAGEEVGFLALALLPYLTSELKTIYVDTSSISYLLSTAILMSQKFHGCPPSIESFESYAALSESYDFIEDASSIVFISATTSGSLAKKLVNQTGFTETQIVTLFFSRLPAGQIGIFDISGGKDSAIRSFRQNECELCNAGSRLVRIVGDQFLPETPSNEQILIRKADFTNVREEFFAEFATKDILKWSVVANQASNSREHFFIDVSNFLLSPSEKFNNLLDSKVNKFFSRHTRVIIHLNDAGSAALATAIKNRVDCDEQGESDGAVSMFSVDDPKLAEISANHSVVVVAGAITSGRKLLDASRRLRMLSRKSYIVYFVGFSKLPADSDLSQLERDLKMGGHELIVLRKCSMPRITENTLTSWDVEMAQLNKFNSANPFAESGLSPLLKSRIANLNSRSSNDSDSLFLPTVANKQLSLRQTFAFWSGINLSASSATQSDVYWTINSILHDLRKKTTGGLGSIYHTTVISPTCFDRYNDGIIQAALIRSATSLELNYSIDENFSQKMKDVIDSVIENSGSDQGEAVLEFLLGLWVGKITLLSSHVFQIVEKFESAVLGDDVKFMLAQIEKKYRC
jgi:hypothetical protein